MTNRDKALTAFLECGTDDLSILDDVEYDVGKIIENLYAEGVRPSLNAITSTVFRMGKEEMAALLAEEIRNAQDELDANPDYDKTVALNELLFALGQLNPNDDIDWHCNCLDTNVYFVRNEELYRIYLPDAIETVEAHMGFSF